MSATRAIDHDNRKTPIHIRSSGNLRLTDKPAVPAIARRIDTLQLDDQELGLRGRFLERSVFF